MTINYKKEQDYVDAIYRAIKRGGSGGIKRPKMPDGWLEEYLENRRKREMKEKGCDMDKYEKSVR